MSLFVDVVDQWGYLVVMGSIRLGLLVGYFWQFVANDSSSQPQTKYLADLYDKQYLVGLEIIIS